MGELDGDTSALARIASYANVQMLRTKGVIYIINCGVEGDPSVPDSPLVDLVIQGERDRQAAEKNAKITGIASSLLSWESPRLIWQSAYLTHNPTLGPTHSSVCYKMNEQTYSGILNLFTAVTVCIILCTSSCGSSHTIKEPSWKTVCLPVVWTAA